MEPYKSTWWDPDNPDGNPTLPSNIEPSKSTVKMPPKPKPQPKSLSSPHEELKPTSNPPSSTPANYPSSFLRVAEAMKKMRAEMPSNPSPQPSYPFSPQPSTVPNRGYYQLEQYSKYLDEEAAKRTIKMEKVFGNSLQDYAFIAPRDWTAAQDRRKAEASAKQTSEVKMTSQPAAQSPPFTVAGQRVRFRGGSVNSDSTASDSEWEVLGPLSPQISPFEEIPSMSDTHQWVKEVLGMKAAPESKSSDEVAGKHLPSYKDAASGAAQLAGPTRKIEISLEELEINPSPGTYTAYVEERQMFLDKLATTSNKYSPISEGTSAQHKGPMPSAEAKNKSGSSFREAGGALRKPRNATPPKMEEIVWKPLNLTSMPAKLFPEESSTKHTKPVPMARAVKGAQSADAKEAHFNQNPPLSSMAQARKTSLAEVQAYMEARDAKGTAGNAIDQAQSLSNESNRIRYVCTPSGLREVDEKQTPQDAMHGAVGLGTRSPVPSITSDTAASKNRVPMSQPPIKHQAPPNVPNTASPTKYQAVHKQIDISSLPIPDFVDHTQAWQVLVQMDKVWYNGKGPTNHGELVTRIANLKHDYHREVQYREGQVEGNEEIVYRVPVWVEDRQLWKTLDEQEKVPGWCPRYLRLPQQLHRLQTVAKKYADIKAGNVPMAQLDPDINADISTKSIGEPNQILLKAITKELPNIKIPSETGTDPRLWLELSYQYEASLSFLPGPTTLQQGVLRTQLHHECNDQAKKAKANMEAVARRDRENAANSKAQSDASGPGEFFNESNLWKKPALSVPKRFLDVPTSDSRGKEATNPKAPRRFIDIPMAPSQETEATPATGKPMGGRRFIDAPRHTLRENEATPATLKNTSQQTETAATTVNESQGQHTHLQRRQAVCAGSSVGHEPKNRGIGEGEEVGPAKGGRRFL